MFYLQDGAITLLLWRGTLQIQNPFDDKNFLFPIHSLTAFLTMIMLVEHPHWIPSFVFALMAWLMLASQVYRRSLPEVWSRCKSYTEFVEALALGNSREPPHCIEAYENYEEAQAFLGNWQKRIEDAEVAAEKAYEDQIKAQEEYEREMEEIGDTQDTDIATKSGDGMSLDPFKSLLFPVQQNLALICRYGAFFLRCDIVLFGFYPFLNKLTLVASLHSPSREARTFMARMLHCVLGHHRLRFAVGNLPFRSLVLFHQMDCQNRCLGALWTVDEAC